MDHISLPPFTDLSVATSFCSCVLTFFLFTGSGENCSRFVGSQVLSIESSYTVLQHWKVDLIWAQYWGISHYAPCCQWALLALPGGCGCHDASTIPCLSSHGAPKRRRCCRHCLQHGWLKAAKQAKFTASCVQMLCHMAQLCGHGSCLQKKRKNSVHFFSFLNMSLQRHFQLL